MDIETEQISAGEPAFPKTLIVAPIEFSPGSSAPFASFVAMPSGTIFCGDP